MNLCILTIICANSQSHRIHVFTNRSRTIAHAIWHNAQSTLLINSLNKQNAIWTSRTNAIYQFKKHLGKLPARLKEKAASSYETTGLLPGTVKVISAFKAAVSTTKSIRRLLGSQGLKRSSFQTLNVRLLQKRSISVLVYVVLTWAPLTTFQIALPTTAHARYKLRFRPYFRAFSFKEDFNTEVILIKYDLWRNLDVRQIYTDHAPNSFVS